MLSTLTLVGRSGPAPRALVDLHLRFGPPTGMDRRRFLLTSLAGALAAPVAVRAQQARAPFRVGFLVVARNPGVESSFPRGLLDLGYVEGRDVIVEWRDAGGHSDQLSFLAADLVERAVDVIVAGGPEARDAARKATRTIPIVVVGPATRSPRAGQRA
jgi:ABC-type uncharacterized transport system substrate-binding protein